MLEYIRQDQYVYFGVFTHHPSSGYLTAADAQPTYTVRRRQDISANNVISNAVMQTDPNIYGLYNGYFYTSGTMFSNGDYCDVYVSGKVQGLTDLIFVKSFKVGDVFDANITQISGNYINYNDFGASSYFANIKYNKDNLNAQDEYTVNWFKNNQVLSSGNITNPAISVYNTNGNSALFTNKKLTFASTGLGVLRYNETSNITASGESYLVIASGTIDGATRTWQNLIGIDAL